MVIGFLGALLIILSLALNFGIINFDENEGKKLIYNSPGSFQRKHFFSLTDPTESITWNVKLTKLESYTIYFIGFCCLIFLFMDTIFVIWFICNISFDKCK